MNLVTLLILLVKVRLERCAGGDVIWLVLCTLLCLHIRRMMLFLCLTPGLKWWILTLTSGRSLCAVLFVNLLLGLTLRFTLLN